MRLSTKCRYGARAIVEIAKNYEKGAMKRKDIAQNQKISDSYLENILIALKNGGIIDTIRGANGGYILRREPAKITLLEVVNVLEGSLAPVECIDNPQNCEKIDTCSTRMAWKRLMDAKEQVLGSITIQELVDYENNQQAIDYTI